MRTPRFEPTPLWLHALQASACAQHCLLVAEEQGRIVGWCRVFPLDTCPGDTQRVDVGIGLLPEYRERGLGRSMLRRALRWAGRRNIELATLTTRADNRRAIHVFELCGFHHTTCQVDEWLEMVCHLQPSGGYGDARSSVSVRL